MEPDHKHPRRRRGRRMVVWIVCIVAGAYGALVALAYVFQQRLVYFPVRELEATPDGAGLAYEPVALATEDGVRLSAWFVPADEPRAVVLFCHGNAGNISHRLETLGIFHRLRLSTLIFDYRGYGQSEGSPSEEGTNRDAEAAWRYLVEQRQISPERIVVFGRSLGGGVASWLAHQHTPGALVLESTFTSIPDVAAKLFPFLPVRLLARIRYPTLSRLPDIRCPLLVVHSPDDELIPFAHGQRLFEAANEPKAFLEIHGGHNEGFSLSGRTYVDGLDAFLTRHPRR